MLLALHSEEKLISALKTNTVTSRFPDGWKWLLVLVLLVTPCGCDAYIKNESLGVKLRTHGVLRWVFLHCPSLSSSKPRTYYSLGIRSECTWGHHGT